MTTTTRRVLFWTPRVLCILYAVFLSLFALDVFDAGYGFWQAIAALLIHLIPVYIVIAVLVLAWHLSISGPLFLIAILFLLNWLYRKQRNS